MLWTVIAMTLVVVSLALAAIRRRRPADTVELGAVSDRWIARYSVESPNPLPVGAGSEPR